MVWLEHHNTCHLKMLVVSRHTGMDLMHNVFKSNAQTHQISEMTKAESLPGQWLKNLEQLHTKQNAVNELNTNVFQVSSTLNKITHTSNAMNDFPLLKKVTL